MEAQLASESWPLVVDGGLNPKLNTAAILKGHEWQLEPKLDGVRLLASHAFLHNRNGEPLTKPIPTAVRTWAAGLPAGFVVDGELVGETFHVFDVLALGTAMIQEDRTAMLATLAELQSWPECIQVVEVATTENAKLNMLNRAWRERWEGVVLKNRLAFYRPGRCGAWVKVKFTKTVDCVISHLHTDREAADVAVHRNGSLQDIGTVSRLGKDVLLGDVVEVTYLGIKSTRLIQPRITRIRRDKRGLDCTYDQLEAP